MKVFVFKIDISTQAPEIEFDCHVMLNLAFLTLRNRPKKPKGCSHGQLWYQRSTSFCLSLNEIAYVRSAIIIIIYNVER